MPGVTPLGLRYPYENETIDATSWQNLANDIDALMTTVNGLRTKAFHTPTASISNLGSGSMAINTASSAIGDMTYNAVNWDTATLSAIPGNPERLNLTAGIWYVRFTAGFLTNITTMTWAGVYIRDLSNNILAVNQTSNITNPNANVGLPLTVDSVVVATGAFSIKTSVQWIGTGGPGHWTDSAGASFQVYRIRELIDN